MDWVNLSSNAKTAMDALGNFWPTVNVNDRQVKGYTMDSDTGECGKTYFTSDDLRDIASGCTEVAEWLDRRAELGE